MSASLSIDNLSFSYGSNRIFSDISLSFGPGVTALVGPNGAGKSTLIKCIAGVLRAAGSIDLTLDGATPVLRKAFFDSISYLPQSLPSGTALTVFEAVLLGLVGTLSIIVQPEQLDRVMETITYLDIGHLRAKRLDQLSGGQLQIVSLAQSLVKGPSVLLLDEPLNNLDIRHQFEVLNIIRDICRDTNRISVLAIHDLNYAARYADFVLVLSHGRVHSFGPPASVLTESTIRDVYGMKTEVTLRDGRVPHIRLVDVIKEP